MWVPTYLPTYRELGKRDNDMILSVQDLLYVKEVLTHFI